MVSKNKILHIKIGGDIEADYKELFSKKPLSRIKQSENMLYLKSYAQLDKLLSPSKMDLLLYLMETQTGEHPLSISDLAKKLDRHQEAISRDITYLKNLGLVTLKQFKQIVYAFPLYTGIDIKISSQ
ncbi:MAG: HTH domain-containing protein [Candidatus Diapherotrites archaeon]|nr:HTH domain-containing protein [Candidatus Diapherotrites archaeon]